MEEYKGYNIVGDNTYGMKEIKAIGRGSVPKELRGRYTTAAMAKRHIDQVCLEKKVKQNDKAEHSD